MATAADEETIERLVDLRQDVDELRLLLVAFHSAAEEHAENVAFLQRCEAVGRQLGHEHKTHTEELRSINQDINHLEDLLKDQTTGFAHRRAELGRRLGEFRADLHAANRSVEAAGVEAKREGVDEAADWFPQWTSELTAEFAPPIVAAGFSPLELPPLFRHLAASFRRPPHSAGGRNEMGNKVKDCGNCGREIHRNAPTCPFCKTKSVSKNARKPKKRLGGGGKSEKL
ncbi:C4H2-type domain-containing protein [Aphelenchoides fujianensis]|nr:C4H2-type domain-containing protein [Aphelenchoides fujianensis]